MWEEVIYGHWEKEKRKISNEVKKTLKKNDVVLEKKKKKRKIVLILETGRKKKEQTWMKWELFNMLCFPFVHFALLNRIAFFILACCFLMYSCGPHGEMMEVSVR